MLGESWRKSRRHKLRNCAIDSHRVGLGAAGCEFPLSVELLEPRLLLTVPAVLSIDRATPPGPDMDLASVDYTVTFSNAVTNVAAADFHVTRIGNVYASPTVAIAGSDASYTVTISGIRGSGQLRLDLVDDDSIVDGSIAPLGGPGLFNGSFQGQTYTIDQSAPVVASIVRASASSLPLGATTADFTVTFSEPVTGVDPGDFTFALGGTVGVAGPVAVAGMNSVYSVTVNGITGSGTLGLNLTDNGSIQDLDGNRLTDDFAAVTFSPQTPPATGNVPISVGAGDLNDDGRPDLVVANFFDHNASVLLGNGNGTFQAPSTYNTGVDPNSALAADVNGDAILDLVVLNYFDANVSVLLGNGNGTFQGQVTYASLANPDSAAAIDVSGDGRPDLVVANRGANSVSVLLGNGDGTFQPQIPYPVGMQPMSLAVSDVNDDGWPDLVAANLAGNSVSVLLGNGNGTFLGQMTFPTGANPQSVAVADFNSDGLQDLVVANSGNNSLGVLLGNGNGSFQPQVPWNVGAMPQAVTVADMNADGLMDLIVANSSDDNLEVLLGDGNGNFFSPSTTASGSTPTAVVSLDVNLDGKPDLVAANQFGNTLSVLLGNLVSDFAGEAYTVPASAVVGRHLFYLGSPAFNVTDEDHPGNSDDNAIAPDKSAYLPNAGSAVFANVSSYTRGINGIMVDLLGAGPHTSINAGDFVFKVGNNNTPASWSAAPAPSAVIIRPGAGTGGADRVEITWATGSAPRNQWLEVQVLATAHTGLAAPDKFYWGNRIADAGTGSPPNNFETTSTDSAQVFASLANNVAISNPRDFNRSGNVDSTDASIVFANLGSIQRLNLGAATPSTVAGRHIFYNQSAYDGNSAAINFASDELARAPDKSAYLPGAGTAVGLNVINYTRGITGIMIDLTAGGTHASISAADFVFKVGNNNLPSSWAAAPAPASIAVSLGGGVGGSDRIEITWASGTITNKWLEVQVLVNAHTGLAGPDVFFWGNRIADSASGTLDNNNFITNSTDASQVFASLTPAGAASITNPRDYNRDKTVNSTDASIVFATLGNLNRLNVGGGGPFAPLGGSFDAGATNAPAGNAGDQGDGDAGIASALAATSDTYDSATPQPVLSPNGSFPPDTTVTVHRIAASSQQFDLEKSPRQLGAARPHADWVLDALTLDEELLDALVRGRRWQSHGGN